jgi:nitronate monooxygenase
MMTEENKDLPVLKIGKHKPRFPIVQGGMGVMISGPKLASAVAACGGVGTIATVAVAASSPSFTKKLPIAVQNKSAIERSIAEARARAEGGVLAVNCMCALTDYEIQVKTACECGIDIIVSGAGLPLKLPELTADFPDVALVPIVSSVKAASLILRRWEKRYGRLPDAFVVETPNQAGGHLGARDKEQAMDEALSLETVVPELIEFLDERGLDIPLIAAGGIWDGEDMRKYFGLGAKGVQLGTRFAATEEGDAPDGFKQAYIRAKKEDVVLIDSPCGLPGRALLSPLIEKYIKDAIDSVSCWANCLSQCRLRTDKLTFCIADALISAYRGDWENGLFFCGTNVWKVKAIQKVKDIFDELIGVKPAVV